MGCGPVVGFTQILLPTGLLVRRADSTQAIGNALVAKAGGAGFRSIAARGSGGPSRRSADGCGPSGSRTRSGWGLRDIRPRSGAKD